MNNSRKRFIGLGLAGVLSIAGLVMSVASLALVEAQVQPIDVGAQSDGRFAFDWNGQYADGLPMAETKSVELHYIPVPPTPDDPSSGDGHWNVVLPLVAVVGENQITMKLALEGIPAGVYDLDIRLIGVGGNPSAYSTPVLALRVRVKNPAPPTNVRVVGG